MSVNTNNIFDTITPTSGTLTISGVITASNGSQSIVSSASPGSDTYITSAFQPVGAGGILSGSFRIELYGTSSTNVTVNIRCGSAGTTSDTSLLSFTINYPSGASGSAAFYARAIVTFRTQTSAIASANYDMEYNAAFPGLLTVSVGSAVTGLTPTYLGASVNGGTVVQAVVSQIK